MSGRLMNANQMLIPACSDACRPTSSPLPTITTKKTAAVKATAMVICRILLRKRGTVSFLPDTTSRVVSSMALKLRLALADGSLPADQSPVRRRAHHAWRGDPRGTSLSANDRAPSVGGRRGPDAVHLVDIAAELDDAV